MILWIIGYFKEINQGDKIMSESKRVYHSADVKVLAIKRHLVNKEKVSDIADELGIHPNMFYEWQSKFFENGSLAFTTNKEKKALEKQVEKLSSKSDHKDKVITELVTELYDLKKKSGES